MKIKILYSTLLILLVGCGEEKIDASSEESMKASIQVVKDSLPKEKREEFEEAVRALALSEIGSLREVSANPEGIKRRVQDKLHGKTAGDVINEGGEILANRKIKERHQAENEILELTARIERLENAHAKSEEVRLHLNEFSVSRSRFYYEEGSFSVKPIIELTVQNNTQYAISKAYFEGVLVSPNRSVPWVKDSFNHQIPGGVEPGEEVTWKLSPNMFGEWSNAPRDREDMILTVKVIRLDGANEEALFGAEFSQQDQEELDRFKVRLLELEKFIVE